MIVLVPGNSMSLNPSRRDPMPNSSRVVFSGENDDIEHFQALALRRIQPDKRRHECHPGLPSASDINRSS
jgi:hypothetical protein